ncbi:MAG: hypothetical protein R3C44_22160 [Chloroflexota bacterium]
MAVPATFGTMSLAPGVNPTTPADPDQAPNRLKSSASTLETEPLEWTSGLPACCVAANQRPFEEKARRRHNLFALYCIVGVQDTATRSLERRITRNSRIDKIQAAGIIAPPPVKASFWLTVELATVRGTILNTTAGPGLIGGNCRIGKQHFTAIDHHPTATGSSIIVADRAFSSTVTSASIAYKPPPERLGRIAIHEAVADRYIPAERCQTRAGVINGLIAGNCCSRNGRLYAIEVNTRAVTLSCFVIRNCGVGEVEIAECNHQRAATIILVAAYGGIGNRYSSDRCIVIAVTKRINRTPAKA